MQRVINLPEGGWPDVEQAKKIKGTSDTYIFTCQGNRLTSSLSALGARSFFLQCQDRITFLPSQKFRQLSSLWWEYARIMKYPVIQIRRTKRMDFSLIMDCDPAYPQNFTDQSLQQIHNKVSQYWREKKGIGKKDKTLGSLGSSLISLYRLDLHEVQDMAYFCRDLWEQQPKLQEIWDEQTGKKEIPMSTVKLFKDGNVMAIQTTASDEGEFSRAFSSLLSNLIDTERYKGDWEFQLSAWLPQFIEICCKLRGYKADVHEQRVITAGVISPAQSDLVALVDEKGAFVSYENGKAHELPYLHSRQTDRE